jgi:hypothetical protein
MLFGMLYLELFSELENFEIFVRKSINYLEKKVKNLSPVRLDRNMRAEICRNMLCKIKHKTEYSVLEFLEIRFRFFLFSKFLEKMSKKRSTRSRFFLECFVGKNWKFLITVYCVCVCLTLT